MPAQDDNQLHPLEDMKTGFHLLLIVAHTYAFSVKVFLHTGMGRRAFGRTALLVPILIPLHMAACAEFNVAPLGWFWCAYLTMCVYHGLQLGRRMSQGRANDVHTITTEKPGSGAGCRSSRRRLSRKRSNRGSCLWSRSPSRFGTVPWPVIWPSPGSAWR